MATFVDTNVLVYAEDMDAGRKHEIARSLVLQLWDDRTGVLSIQVLQEFYITVTRKLRRPMSSAKALKAVQEYLTWSVVDNTSGLLVDAIALQRKAKLSFWDSLIVQAALDAGCDRLCSEDMNHTQRFGALTVTNPFADC